MGLQAKQGTKYYSIINLKCPRCQKGDLFKTSNAYNLLHMLDMPDSCPVCQQDFVKEPGFYSGALWVSYPIVIIIMLVACLCLYFIAGLPFMYVMGGALLILLALQPLIMRYSRAIWINLFVDFKGN